MDVVSSVLHRLVVVVVVLPVRLVVAAVRLCLLCGSDREALMSSSIHNHIPRLRMKQILHAGVGQGGVGDVRFCLLIGIFIIIVSSQTSGGQWWHFRALDMTSEETDGE